MSAGSPTAAAAGAEREPAPGAAAAAAAAPPEPQRPPREPAQPAADQPPRETAPLQPQLLPRETAAALFEAVAADFPPKAGKAVSEAARAAHDDGEDSTLVYGEVRFDSFAKIFDKLRGFGGLGAAGGLFVDLGSGVGKPCLAAALLHPFARVAGVELLPPLHAESQRLAAAWAERRPAARAGLELDFRCGDFCAPEHDWWADEGAAVVYANSTCFTWPLMDRIAERAERLPPGAFVVTGTKGLRSPCFDELFRELMLTSWGRATVVIQRRNALPPPPPGEPRVEQPRAPPPPPFEIPWGGVGGAGAAAAAGAAAEPK